MFKLYEGTSTETTKFLGDYVTNENGVVVIPELESNQYYTVQEAQPPYGYFLDEEDNPQTILIKPEALGENMTIVFRNMPKPKLLITKIDADTGEPLPGGVPGFPAPTAEYVDGPPGRTGPTFSRIWRRTGTRSMSCVVRRGMSPTTPITTSSSSPAKPPSWW